MSTHQNNPKAHQKASYDSLVENIPRPTRQPNVRCEATLLIAWLFSGLWWGDERERQIDVFIRSGSS